MLKPIFADPKVPAEEGAPVETEGEEFQRALVAVEVVEEVVDQDSRVQEDQTANRIRIRISTIDEMTVSTNLSKI